MEKKEGLVKENAKLSSKVSKIEEADLIIEQNKNKIQLLEAKKQETAIQMAKMTKDLDQLETTIEKINYKLQVCKNLIDGFKTEREAWQTHISKYEEEKKELFLKALYLG